MKYSVVLLGNLSNILRLQKSCCVSFLFLFRVSCVFINIEFKLLLLFLSLNIVL